MKRILWLSAFALTTLSVPAMAQHSLEATCDRAEIQLLDAREACLAAVQAALSAQPTLGILIAGGNPTIGGAGAAGFRLGLIPRVSAGVRLNVVPVRLPGILAEQVTGQVGAITRRYGAPAPALTGDVAVSLSPGMNVAPGIGGIGALSLLGSATFIPFQLLGAGGFERSDLAFGLGARVHLLRESFVAPGVSASLMRKQMNQVAFGNVCPHPHASVQVPGTSPPQQVSACPAPGDAGEFAVDLVDWSTRLVASKSLFGFGAAVGLGHDRYRSDLDFGFRAREPIPGTQTTPIFRVADERLNTSRWTVFGNLAFSLLVASIGVEAGWQQGTPPISGFRNIGSDFDPRGGTWYGSLGTRLAL
jgi:hypothetical protein